MNDRQILVTIFLLALATALTRFVPFLIFSRMKRLPRWVEYLGRLLPSAMMGLLVVYCFRNLHFADAASAAPMLLASVSVVLMYLWKRNTIAGIAVGTAVYMILIRLI